MNIQDISCLENRVIGKVLAAQARDIPESIWMLSNDRKVTFSEADRLVNGYAAGLRSCGVKASDTIALVCHPSIDAILIGLAATRLGAIYTTISTDYRGEFLKESLVASRAEILVIDRELSDRVDDLDSRGAVKHIFTLNEDEDSTATKYPDASQLLAHGDAPIEDCGKWSDVAQIWWSSGTTGKSKGVMHSHSSVLHLGAQNAATARAGDIMYVCTPIYLGSPWSGAIWASLVGGLTAAIDRQFSVSKFWDRIRFYNATQFLTLGSMHIHLWRAPLKDNDRDNKVWKATCYPMPYDILPRFKERFGIEQLPQGFGQSETFQIFSAPDDGTKWHGAALGRAEPWYEVKLFDPNDQEVDVGEVGEICVRPREPGIMYSGYFNMPDFTLDTWRTLWHHTGDMATRDADGIYYFADRKKDYIRYKGRNISMNEVEAIIARHPAVLDVATFGIQSEELESEAELMAAVVLQSGQMLDALTLAEFINENAPYYFVPRFIDFVIELPRNAHGRVLKNDLRDRGVTSTTWDQTAAGFKAKR
jgi:crotonobetaine/carnitine-CoA ligase